MVRYGEIVREMFRRALRRAVPLATLPAVLAPSVLATFELRVSRFSAVISSAAARFLPEMPPRKRGTLNRGICTHQPCL
jgi:hypothetical protein